MRRTDVLLSILDRTPRPWVSLAMRLRSVLAPQPWPHDVAAVLLHRTEQRGRGLLPYPQYLYGLLSAARTARAVGVRELTAVEFGVAGGNGLLALEQHADLVERRLGVHVTVVGLDSGAGLLPASDPRDCGFALPPGEFAGDPAELRIRLRSAELVLGDVTETVGPFAARIDAGELPPLGFVAHDLDVYTGTRAALDALGALGPERMLPRVPMFFDDLTGYPYTTVTAEHAAIADFNTSNDRRQIGQVFNLANSLGGHSRWAAWPAHTFVLHAFDHPRYDASEHVPQPDLTLRRP